MKKLLLTFLVCFSAINSLSAEDLEDTPLGFRTGYRHDDLTISGRSRGGIEQVNRFKWNNINSYILGFNIATYTEYNIFFKANYDYSVVLDGNLDIDTSRFSSDDFDRRKSLRGRTIDTSIACGFPIWFNCCDPLRIIPLLGYSFDKIIVHGRGRVHQSGIGIRKVESHYNTKWDTPFAGVDLEVPFCDCWWLHAGYEFHWGHYRSKAKVKEKNLFTYHINQKGTGNGQKANIGIGWNFWPEWSAYFSGNYARFNAGGGRDRSHFEIGDVTSTFKTKVKDYNWQYWALRFDILYQF